MIQTIPFCDLVITSGRRRDSVIGLHDTSQGIVVDTVLGTCEMLSHRSLFISTRQPLALACHGRKPTIRVSIKTSHSSIFAMATSAASSDAEKLARHALYYPHANSQSAAYIKVWFEMMVGLAAPPALDENILGTYDSSLNSFYSSKWWNYGSIRCQQ